MTQKDDILLRPSFRFALLNALPLALLALSFLLLAWRLSANFVFFGLAAYAAACYQLLSIRSFSYLITTGYIRITRGIFFKRTDEVELFRVKDYIITQSFLLELCKLMCLTLKGTDPENPVIQIRGARESNLMDMIRERVEQARKNNKIYELNWVK